MTGPLTAHDRCDRCGAQALVEATDGPQKQLLFCGHHGRKYVPALVKAGWVVFNETGGTYEASTGQEVNSGDA